jgi:hypothetical protein
MTMLTLDTYPIPSPDVVGRIINKEAVLVLPDKGEVKVLNEVGARIWTLADGTRSVRDIAAAICAEYDVEPAQAEADVLAFLTELETRGIISLSPDSATDR